MRLIPTPVALALRDLRGGLGGLWFVVLQIALAVAMMAAIAGLSGAVLDGLSAVGRTAAGGDLSLRLFHAPATAEQRRFLDTLGTVSETAELRPVVTAPGGARTLVELKAVDAAYPLYGEAALTGGGNLHQALALQNGAWGAVVGAELLEALSLSVGDRLRLGDLSFIVRGVLAHEPDRLLRAFSLGPRVIISRTALRATGLTPPGAPVYFYYRLKLPETASTAAAIERLTDRFPDAGWRIVDGRQGLPGAERTVQLARTLFLLTGVAVLLVGGIGVGNAVRAHLERRLPTAATLKVLGARPRTVFGLFLTQVSAASLLAGLVGGAIGLGLAAAALALAPEWITEAASPWQPEALALSVAVGVLATLAFALRPLAQAAARPPREVWRDAALSRGRGGWRTRLGALGLGVAAVALVGVWTGMPLATVAFLLPCALAAALFAGLGHLVAAAARRLARGRRGPLRVALANLGRPGAPTVPVTVVLGLALTLVVAIGLTGRAAVHHMSATVPAQAPDALALSLPEGDDSALRAQLTAVPGVKRVETVPFLHARISRLNGAPVTEADVPRSVAWAVRGDRGLSWRATPRPGTEIVEGSWWAEDYAGPPRASVDARVAGRLGLSVGDTLTLATPVGPVTATVANLRRMDWTALELDFPILLSPPPEPPPHSRVAAVWAAPQALAAVEDVVAEAVQTAPVLHLAPILERLRATVDQVRALLAGLSAVALVAAALVLTATVLASARARRRDAVILRALGVARGQITRATALEFALLGGAVAAIAVPLGAAAGAAISLGVTEAAAVSLALPMLALGGTVVFMAAVGLLVARGLRRLSLAAELRLSEAE